MNFIIELIPKKDCPNVFSYVVRSANGFPITVCDSLDDAKIVIQDEITKFLKTAKKEA